ncbi:hypothetical protein TSUD_349480 [Trifolium subterraneum]|uniref:PRONE domain-containing protein n=1 Tax=Trifolium subterraneum TaxID=3900 RepID=A0A2Z6NJU8_TRISU|nr:hypothetical protein TSUD_349480 [Trifolium subterraneum]
MDNSSNFDSTSSVDQNDHLISETPEYSPFSGDSFAYCRSNSEVSNLSEAIDDNSYASDPSPSPWMSVKHGAVLSRFSKLLLGEDMSGGGKGVCTAVTISNSITNLYDIYINLPALQKLDTMLIEIFDSFQDTEFWYAEQGSISGNSNRSSHSSAGSHSKAGSFRIIAQRKDEKWWLPVPCVHSGGLSDKSKKHLIEKRDCANQIHKAAMAINSSVLAEMDIPETYMANLPKSGRSSLGDAIYRYMHSGDKFSPGNLLDCLKISTEHEALELADRVESSMYTWRRKACLSHSKSSWNKVKEFMADTGQSDKNFVLAERAETLLFFLKQRYPELSQTSLDTCKIQYNQINL